MSIMHNRNLQKNWLSKIIMASSPLIGSIPPGSLTTPVGWLCFTSHRQQGISETAPPFTVPCKGCEALFLHCS